MAADGLPGVATDPSASPMPVDARPRVVTELRAILVLVAAVSTVAFTIVLARATPLPEVAIGGALALSLTGTILAYRALGRRQRWAIWYTLAILVVLIASGLWEVVSPARPGTLTIPVGTIIAVVALLRVSSSWDSLRAHVNRSAHMGRMLTVAIAATLAAPLVMPGVTAGLADPTQVTAADLDVRLAVSCQPSPTDPVTQTVIATATFTWHRTDLLPAGLLGALDGPRDHDQVLVSAVWGADRPTDPEAAQMWALTQGPTAAQWMEPGFMWGPDAGATVSLGGGTPGGPTREVFPDAASMSLPVSIVPERMSHGRPYTAAWQYEQRGPIPWPAVRVRYVHEYRFAVEATARCGEAADARPAR